MTIYRLAEDTYVDWSDNTDSPRGLTATRRELRDELVRDATRTPRLALRELQEDGTPDPEWVALIEDEIALAVRRVDLRLARADRFGTSGMWTAVPRTPAELVAGNRAGPRESCLTLDAILRRYSPDPAVRDAFVFTPADVEPYWTNDWWSEWTGELGEPVQDETGEVPEVYVWVPWPPGAAPAEITPETDLHARVLIGKTPPTAG